MLKQCLASNLQKTFESSRSHWYSVSHSDMMGPVTKIENIKTDSTKILRPTHFSGSKDIKTNLTN
jgi:hypothetical protein